MKDVIINLRRSVPANFLCQQIGRAIVNAAVEVDTEVVVGSTRHLSMEILIIVHVRWLPAGPRIARSADMVRILEIAQRPVGIMGPFNDLLGNQPVAAVDHRAENVGKGFVERARFACVFETAGFVDDPVCPFVGDDIQSFCVRIGANSAIAKEHRPTVPESVVYRLPVFAGDVYVRIDRPAV